MSRWHQTLMVNEFIAIEEGMITGSRIDKLVVRPEAASASAEDRGTMSSTAVTYTDRALRAAFGTWGHGWGPAPWCWQVL